MNRTKRNAWIIEAALQVRQWREQDERNNQPWDNSTPREAAVSPTSERPHYHD